MSPNVYTVPPRGWLSGSGGGRPGKEVASRTPSAPSAHIFPVGGFFGHFFRVFLAGFGCKITSGGVGDDDESSGRLSEISGRSSEIFGRSLEISGRFFGYLREIFGDLQEIFGDLREIFENFDMILSIVVYRRVVTRPM